MSVDLSVAILALCIGFLTGIAWGTRLAYRAIDEWARDHGFYPSEGDR